MKAELIDHMGSDLTVVNAARVSFDKESEWDALNVPDELGGGTATALSDKDSRLVSYLARHGHWTPFAHPQITMRETVPIFVARQRFKHMVGFTYNEVSRRYVDDEPEFYQPGEWRNRPEGSVKQGSAGKHRHSDNAMRMVESHNRQAFLLYNAMVDNGIAPEQARMVLPQSMYTSYYVTGSLAAWARAYRQRIDAHAQVEIQQLAHQWGDIIAPLFPVSWAALTE